MNTLKQSQGGTALETRGNVYGQEHEFPSNPPLLPKLGLENIKVLRARTISSWNEISTPGCSAHTAPPEKSAPPRLPPLESDSGALKLLTLELHPCLVRFAWVQYSHLRDPPRLSP